MDQGAPIRGIVYAPACRRLFYTDSTGLAIEEKGAFDISKMEKKKTDINFIQISNIYKSYKTSNQIRIRIIKN